MSTSVPEYLLQRAMEEDGRKKRRSSRLGQEAERASKQASQIAHPTTIIAGDETDSIEPGPPTTNTPTTNSFETPTRESDLPPTLDPAASNPRGCPLCGGVATPDDRPRIRREADSTRGCRLLKDTSKHLLLKIALGTKSFIPMPLQDEDYSALQFLSSCTSLRDVRIPISFAQPVTHLRGWKHANPARFVMKRAEFKGDAIGHPALQVFAGLGEGLVRLRLTLCRNLTHLSGLEHCLQLGELVLWECVAVTDLTAVAKCRSLHTIGLVSCFKANDLRPLTMLPKLKRLVVHNNPFLQTPQVEILSQCKMLQQLELNACTSVDSSMNETRAMYHRLEQSQSVLKIVVR